MKVFVLVDIFLDSPENFGVRVYATREAADKACHKLREEACNNDENYIAEVEECEVES